MSRSRPPIGQPIRQSIGQPVECRLRARLACSLLPLAAAGLLALPAGAAPYLPRNALPVPSTNAARPFVYQGNGNVATTGNAMVVNQLTATLGLNWNSFNIGADASVTFNQPDSLSRVLNRIWSADPSVIMGRLNANGQVYLVNQNGIVFGKDSQVNVGGLVAAALGISETLLEKGLPSKTGESLAFDWAGDAAGFSGGYVAVEGGAKIVTTSGSPVVLLAPSVDNQGTISTAAGAEAILAAGGSVLLTVPTDPNLRGLLVEVKPYKGKDALGNKLSLDGTVTNGGNLDTSGGVVTLAALAVNQKGAIGASKAVNLNGEIILVSGSMETPRLTVTQPGEKAEIDWVAGFNVAPEQIVEFIQPTVGAAAYNYVSILDEGRASSGAENGRSLVNGTLMANGQLYLINQQGIDFGANARVTAGSFAASGLNINPSVVDNGLLMNDNVATRAFYLREAMWTAAEDTKWTVRDEALAAFRPASIAVAAGARIETTTENGFALLAGSRIQQDGFISTPKGQAILAAGADLYLKPPYGQALRGFSAEVNPLFLVQEWRDNKGWQPLSRGGDANAVINTGTVSAPFGNITLVGHQIEQAGVLEASTSATANGSIRLLARDMVNSQGSDLAAESGMRQVDAVTGRVVPNALTSLTEAFAVGMVGGGLRLAPGSVTAVNIDGGDGKLLTADQPLGVSLVEAAAATIEVAGAAGGLPGARVSAAGGQVAFMARNSFLATNAFVGDQVEPRQTATPQSDVAAKLYDDPRAVISPSPATNGTPATIYVGDGAHIDVAGARANRSVADLFMAVELRGDEFAGNPVQRWGALRGQTAWVDVRDKVGIADLSGWFGKLGQTVEERLGTGGSLSLASMGSVVVAHQASLDVSGGRVDYAAAEVRESRAVASSGKDYRLNDAPASIAYSGLVTASREVEAYTEGRNAGSIEVVGNSLAVAGHLIATTERGASQRNIGDPASDRYAIPVGGKLVVRDAGQHFAPASAGEAAKTAAYEQAQIVFVAGAANAGEALANGLAGPRLELSSSLVTGGFSRFDLQSDGRIELPADVALNMRPGGSFKAAGRQVVVAGDLTIPGGGIELITRDMSLPRPGALLGSGDARYSTLLLTPEASLSTAGVWVNDYLANALSSDPRVLADGNAAPRTGAAVAYEPKAVTGGSITLTSAHDLDLRAGSRLDVSGGARVTSVGKLENGNAGSIKLSTGGMGKEGAYGSYDDTAANIDLNRRDGSLFLDGSLSGYALGAGGKLEINSSAIRLGETFTADSRDWSRTRRLDSGQVGAAFAADFLHQGGFYEFKFVGRDGLTVRDDTCLQPTPIGWSLAQVPDFRYQAAGSAIAGFAATVAVDPALLPAPTRLSLATRSMNYGHLTVGDRTALAVSAQGSIDIESWAQLTVLGTLEAPAGAIRLVRPLTKQTFGDNAGLVFSWDKRSESIYLGPESRLLAAGATVLDAATRAALAGGTSEAVLRSQNRYRTQVLDGGTVELSASLGYLVTRTGSVIDVSGAAGSATLVSGVGTGLVYTATGIGSAGGKVNLAAREGMFLDGAYLAAGAAGAAGGVFSLRLADNAAEADPWQSALLPISDYRAVVAGPRQLTLFQSTGSHPAQWPRGVPAGDYLKQHALIFPALDGRGQARLDLAPMAAAGFGSWYLGSQNEIRFEGAIDATVANQLRLDAPAFSAASDATRLNFTAGAIQLGNYSQSTTPSSAATTGAAEALFQAEDVALAGMFSWNGFAASRFASRGEIHFDSRINGAANRVGGRLFNGQMTAAGELNFSAGRLSPSTYSDFRVDLLADPAGRIVIDRDAAGTALADSMVAGGRLEFAAPTIDQRGTVVAPLGEIVFSAPGGSVSLGETSVTSVAASRDLLFGATDQSGRSWSYSAADFLLANGGVQILPTTVTDLPAKAIRIDAADTDVKTGARIDLSGGGEAIAWEFSPGPGGKSDVLAAAATTEPGTFAVLPGWAGNVAPLDSQSMAYYNVSSPKGATFSAVPALKVGDQVTLAANPAGLDGTYTLLPARYALLPGAYLVTVKPAQDAVQARFRLQADGAWLVSAARQALNTGGSLSAYSQLPLTVELADSAVVSRRASYITSSASGFFFDRAGANLPGDAGYLAAIGRTSLAFDPSIIATRAVEIAATNGSVRAGRGAALDLAAPKLAVGGVAPDDGWSVLDAAKLNALGVSSLLLGGRRSQQDETTAIETIASVVRVAGALSGPELMATAGETVVVQAGGAIAAIGSAEVRQVALSGDGAFLRAAAGEQAGISRAATVLAGGDLLVEAGASVSGNALVLDATRHNTLAGTVAPGTLQTTGERADGYLAIGAGRVNLVGDVGGVSLGGKAPGGDTPSVDGLTLDNATLAGFTGAKQWRIGSYTTLDLYGSATLGTAGLNELVLAAAGVAGHGEAGDTARLVAGTVRFENPNPASTSFTAGAALGGGKLAVAAGSIVFADNATQAMREADGPGFALRGFADVHLAATGELRFEGVGVTHVDNDGRSPGLKPTLTVEAGRLVTAGGADHAVLVDGAAGLHGGGTVAAATSLGGALEVTAESLDVSGRIETPAGRLKLTAYGGDLRLRSGARLLADGQTVTFGDTEAYAPGGEVALTSHYGNLAVEAGATISVSGGAGSDAGRISLTASKGAVSAGAGSLLGRAGSGKALTGGELRVDGLTVALNDLAGATEAANGRQLTGAWDIRARGGDLTLGAGKTIAASEVLLAADGGNIDVAGIIDASGAKGGRIELYANRSDAAAGDRGGHISLRAGGELKANATEVVTTAKGTAGEGGTVILGVSATRSADEGNTGISTAAASGGKAAALIDVSAATGGAAGGGKVIFRVPRKDVVAPALRTLGNAIIGRSDVIRVLANPVASSVSLATATFKLTPPWAMTSYAKGMEVSFQAPTNVASTLAAQINVSNKGAKSLLDSRGVAVSAKSLSGKVVVAVYDGSAFRLVSTAANYPVTVADDATFKLSPLLPMDRYLDRMLVAFEAPILTLLTAATINVSNKGAVALVDADGKAVTATTISGKLVTMVYDGTATKPVFRLVSANAYKDASSQATFSVAAPKVTSYDLSSTANFTRLDAGQQVSFRANSSSYRDPRAGSVVIKVKVNGKVVTKNLKLADGEDLRLTGTIAKDELVTAVYDSTYDEFRVVRDTILVADKVIAGSTLLGSTALSGQIRGADTVALEGVRTVKGMFVVSAAQQAVLMAELAQAGGNADAVRDRVASDGLHQLSYLPSLELRSDASMTVSNDWSLATARYNYQPGVLTLRAAGDLLIKGTISDGFGPSATTGTPIAPLGTERDGKLAAAGLGGRSWSYRLVAGGDLAAANPLAVKAPGGATGHLDVAAGKLVRTGTGDIEMAAAGDIRLQERAAVYTAGVADGVTLANVKLPSPSDNAVTGPHSNFPTDGGDLRVAAGGSISQAGDGKASWDDWLVRFANDSFSSHWYPRFASVQNGFGALGGGDVRVTAGGDLNNVAVAIPTNGRIPKLDGVAQPDLARISGGGDLAARAGGSIVGGQYYAETGTLLLRADGSITGDPRLGLGNTFVRATAGQDLGVGKIANPLATSRVVPYRDSAGTALMTFLGQRMADFTVRFGTYGEDSAIDLVAIAGDLNLTMDDTAGNGLAPSRFKAAALSGDISGNELDANGAVVGEAGVTLLQMPGAAGQLDLLAAQGMRINRIVQYDTPADRLPSLANPVNFVGVDPFPNPASPTSVTLVHARDLWHQDDRQPSRLIALGGDLVGSGSNISRFAEAVDVQAAGSIKYFGVVSQHADSGDVTRIAAGKDIVFTSGTDDASTSPVLQVNGPGRLEVTAGGSIDLGSSKGIVTRGSLENPFLATEGADILVLAGSKPDYAAFRRYLGLGEETSEATLRGKFYALLRQYGRESLTDGGQVGYAKGREVIEVLFPVATTTGGNLDLFYSQIKTEQGGDIDLLVPNGGINVGILNANKDLEAIKKKSEQGLFTIRGGDINAYVHNSFLVNQSRVFTLDGGNILAWANLGSIDAGKGAKTVTATPPPVLVIRNGQIVLDTSNAVSGSGIGVLTSRDDTPASDMDLFAPQGDIDAGDAGLRSTGNVFLGAQRILNASNIQAQGSVAGVPAVASPVTAAPAPADPGTAQKTDAVVGEGGGNRQARQGILTVEVLAGEEAPVADEPDAEEKKRRKAAKPSN